MADRDERAPELPPPLRRAARELGQRAPESALRGRLMSALDRAEAEEARRVRLGSSASFQRSKLWGTLLIACSAAGVILGVKLLSRSPEVTSEGSRHQRFEERAVSLTQGGEAAWLDLDLWTHYHGDEDASVQLEVPSSVRVEASKHSTASTAEPDCSAERCVHRFITRTAHRENAPVRIGIDMPGRYRIHIEHASPKVRVSEVFVVDARP